MTPVLPQANTAAPTADLIVTVGPVAHGGHCVARHEGRVIFVRHALPGEVVKVRLTDHEEGASFWRADVVEILEPSADRVPHFWPEADAVAAGRRGKLPVGGAEFGHISRNAQLALKEAVLREQLQRLAGIDAEWIAARAGILDAGVEDIDANGTEAQQAGLGWRTRAAFAVTPSGRLGMHAHRSTQIVPVSVMPLAVDAINELRLWEIDLTGISRIEVAAPANGSVPLVLLAPGEELGEKAAGLALKRVSNAIKAAATGPVSVAGWNPESGATTVLAGRGWVSETAAGHEFRVTGAGFWQIHRQAPAVLTDVALGYLSDGGFLAPGAGVADLYAGAGLFTAPLADAVGETGTVLSVEGSAGTSRDARKNLHAAPQVSITQGRVERVLSDARRSFDAVVLDPPRAGAGKAVVRQLAATGPRAIAYVSCDPASFARDLSYFRNNGWELAALRAFDLYPHTHHLETVALLTPGERR
ncbi:class I SAM-dependent RNA methyltransferase [Arthrobacter sp. 35W]|uniref:class I SAM-dependent RNA methyltransferase n=1 Tax=Arthrobacter sp. 35W TaxID=1132441 RepID=UPI0004218C3C|nr:TRAM domain-containing protein [Arthrobacter sp. 35W]